MAAILISTFTLIHFQNNQIATAQQEIVFEKIVNVKQKYLLETMSNLKKYPKIIPDNINSVQLIEEKGNQAVMNVGLEGITFDVKTEYTVLPDGSHFIEVLDGDLKGTKLTTTLKKTWGYDGTNNGGTNVKMKLSLETSGALSLITALASDESILFALDSSLIKFVRHAKVEQNYVEIVIPALQNWKDFEKISFWFKDSNPKNTVKFYLRGDRLQISTPFILETNSTEWKKIEIMLTAFSKINLEKVRGVSFFFESKEGSFAIDDIILSSEKMEKKLTEDDITSLFLIRRSNSANSILIQDSDDFRIGKLSTNVQTSIVEGTTEMRYDFAFPGKKSTIKELKPAVPEKLDISLWLTLGIISALTALAIFMMYSKRKTKRALMKKGFH